MTAPVPPEEPPAWAEPARSLRLTVDEAVRRTRALRTAPWSPKRTYGFSDVGIKPSAALLALVEHGGEAAVLVTKRPMSMRLHPGEWVLPGGRIDPETDASPLDAALREFQEELGVPPLAVEPIGQLATYGPFVTGYLLHMFVGVLGDPTAVRPNQTEVEEVLAVPLSRLTRPGVYRTGPLPDGHDLGPEATALGIEVSRVRGDLRFFMVREGEYMWGTQGEVLWDFLTLVFTEEEGTDGG